MVLCYATTVFRRVAWWRVKDEAKLWLAFLFVIPVLLWAAYVALGVLVGF
jgi:hypothetical protein